MKPKFDEDKAKSLIGKHVIIGVSVYDHYDEKHERPLEFRQFHGDIVRVNEREGVVIKLTTGEEYKLPPDLSVFKEAPPGEYRLHSTGEIVVNPDLMTTWVIHKGAPEEKGEGKL